MRTKLAIGAPIVLALLFLLLGQITLIGLFAVAVLSAITWLPDYWQKVDHGFGLFLARLILFLICLGLMTHSVPGFHNIPIWQQQFSDNTIEHSFYWNWDKLLLAAVLLPWVLARDSRCTISKNPTNLPLLLGVFLLTITASLSLAWQLDLIRFHSQLGFVENNLGKTALFALSMLVITVTAEECIFRGFLQRDFGQVFARYLPLVSRGAAEKTAEILALVLISGLFFGAVHAGFSSSYALVAGVAGLGYGAIYWLGRSIIWPIALHFVLNTVHFLSFSYPILQ